MSSKYYWLKLKRDFFKRHDIRIVEETPNGKEYILFYLKLLCESVDHDGNLRFSDQIPYNEEMLSVITNTNVDVVRSAVKIFTELKMMEILDDGTIFMAEVEGMLGFETEWAKKKREYRERQTEERTIEGQCPQNVLTMSDKSKSIEKEIEKEKEKDNKRKRFSPPTLDEVKAYCDERKNNVDAERFVNYYESNGWMVGKSKMKDWKAAVRTWEKNNYNKKATAVAEMPDYIRDQIDGKKEEPKVDFPWLDKYK